MLVNRRWLRWWPLALLFFALRSTGQDALRKRVSLPSTVIAAGELRQEISRQTGLQFSFGSNTIRPGQMIRLPRKDFTAKALLDVMKLQLKADYKVYKDHIIFTKHSQTRNGANRLADVRAHQKKQPTPDADKLTGKLDKTGKSADGGAGQKINSKPNTDNLVGKLDKPRPAEARLHQKDASAYFATSRTNTENTTSPAQRNPGYIQLSAGPSSPTVYADERLRQRAYRLTPERRDTPRTIAEPPGGAPAFRQRKSRFGNGNGLFSRYTATGMEVTEYFPANAVLKAGLPVLHGIIGYSSNISHGSLRYGAGSRWTITDRWHAQAQFTTGFVVKNLLSDSGIIIPKTIRIKETLHRIGIQAERTLGKRWSLVGGLSWNMLNRTNTDEGARLAPGDRALSDPVPDEGYRAVKPRYTFSSRFDASSKTWKDRWLGIHVGIYLRF
ncbi:hypothetical protein [Chitinophaga rhizosphaerae]|uniref:hypothetical protein n=1 Tax=Chitinophaga rhizosphaerae TaxID=1864947 RepID=UPI000F813963|nr:hypothetical protein [Chitinophaga rhizosphaerae]